MTQIYHITHGSNLAKIIAAGKLVSDRRVQAGGAVPEVIGFEHIKQRRLEKIRVPCCPGTFVGDFVPFYFCPRSVMLFVINVRSAELRYQGGQRGVVHLVTSVERAISLGRPCAFSNGNAGTGYAGPTFSTDFARLRDLLDWDCILAQNWADPVVKEKKQSEFLLHDECPWEIIEQIGVIDELIAARVEQIIAQAGHRPAVVVRRDWYYD